MTMIEAGTQVNKGHYFSAKTWTLHGVAADGEKLPGARGEKYLAVPLVGAFALAPLMGAAFLMFLPFIGFYLVGRTALRPVGKLVRRSTSDMAATMAPGWVPGEAHLTGDPTTKGDEAAVVDPQVAALEKEIAEKRSPKA